MPKKYTRKNKRRRVKRGGQDNDIESGPIENITPMSSVPPDPERFQRYEEQMRAEASRPVSREAAAAIFEGPNPEQRLRGEQEMMADEDPLNKDPFEREDFTIFSEKGGRRSRKKRRNKRKSSRRTRHRRR